jgi:hypothetical protein
MSIFCWGCQVSTGQGRKMDDSAMLKSIGLGFLGRRSKTINASNDVYAEEYALAA